MVAIKEVRASNATLTTSPTALFIGATSGIGLQTIRQLLQHSSKPTIYIVGRSLSAFQTKLTDLESLNQTAKITFIEAQIERLKEVERACNEVKAKESKLDLLWLSSGYLSLNAREETAEGLTKHLVIPYYARILTVTLMLPLLRQGTSPRVVTILAAGREGTVNTSDFGLDNPANYSLPKSADQQTTMTSLAFDLLSKENPHISFIHTYPGFVSTGIVNNLFAEFKGWWSPIGFIGRWAVVPIFGFFAMSEEEAGERGLYVSTASRFNVENNGYYRLGPLAEDAGVNKVYENYKAEGLGKTVWEHTTGVFDRVLAGN